ncbi:DUF2062 domain-containing protein [Maritimibacter fusiformis]|uniref:DUF2062 domain-containing protein n=1 Tax=Maritimibacter fusiformis TaxID=2603819 RepID=A0A5D0REW6_9RHOB|nr:DUF2062 domain-containing protein [Maritimibacter fusiformis]TYB80052.1 DUF2062 domain-containing protein [Maritimibacter fusiformis]
MFKRNPRSYAKIVAEFFYPRGGWYRAARYVIHRVRRLPDPAHRISRGIAAGVFVCFTPFLGLHFASAALLAWLIRGNIIAALLATFFGNPLTFPIIIELSLTLGSWMLGLPADVHLPQVIEAMATAFADLMRNLLSIFTGADADWHRLGTFYHRVFLPYLIGGLPLGILSAAIAYALSRPVITAYQKSRIKRLKKRYEKRMADRAAKADAGNRPR